MTFSEWLSKEIEERGWSYSEVARRGGTSHARISQIISGGETPGADFCVKIAKALEESPEHVLRIAGILDPKPEEPDTAAMIREIWRALKQPQPGPLPRANHVREAKPAYTTQQPAANTSPSWEDIMDILRRLDAPEVLNVFDYATWRLEEQERRRGSDYVRRRPIWTQEEKLRLEEVMGRLSLDEREAILREVIERRTQAPPPNG